MIPREVCIIQDTREQRPLPFPATLSVWDRTSPPTSPKGKTVFLTVHQRALPRADYSILGHTTTVLVERKQDLAELWNNLTIPDRRRCFMEELQILRDSCQHPVLLLEGSPHSLKAASPHVKFDADVCRDLLLDALHPHKIELWFLPSSTPNTRRSTAAWVAAKMISLVFAPTPAEPQPLPQGA